MDDFPTQIADFLESTATKIRSMTVDRLANAARWTGVGIVATPLLLLLLIFLWIALIRFLSRWIDANVSYMIIGGLFVVVGMFLWMLRKPREGSED